MKGQKLNMVRFEAGGKLVQFKAKVPRPKPVATSLFPVSAPKTFKVGIHAKASNPGLLKAAASPGQKKFVLGTRVVVKGPPKQAMLVPKHRSRPT